MLRVEELVTNSLCSGMGPRTRRWQVLMLIGATSQGGRTWRPRVAS